MFSITITTRNHLIVGSKSCIGLYRLIAVNRLLGRDQLLSHALTLTDEQWISTTMALIV